MSKNVSQLSLPLEFYPAPQPTYVALPPVDIPPRPYLDWRMWHGEEGWITRFHAGKLLITAKIEALELVNPDDTEHVWAHRITVHAFDGSDEVAGVVLNDVVAPLNDLDIFPQFDELIHECADQCQAFVNGQPQNVLH